MRGTWVAPEVQRQESGEVDPRPTLLTHRHRKVLALVVAASVMLVASFAFVAFRSTGSRTVRAFSSGSAVGNVTAIASPRLATTIGWLDGLTSGVILPSDIASRLATRHPAAARAVTSAWSVLAATDDARLMEEAILWVDGLADGLILPSDVSSHLAPRHPATARVVIAVWKEVNA